MKPIDLYRAIPELPDDSDIDLDIEDDGHKCTLTAVVLGFSTRPSEVTSISDGEVRNVSPERLDSVRAADIEGR